MGPSQAGQCPGVPCGDSLLPPGLKPPQAPQSRQDACFSRSPQTATQPPQTATPPHRHTCPPPRACQSPLTGRAQFARCAICATSRPNWFDIDRARRFPVDSVTRMGYHSDDPHPPSSRKPWAPVTRPGQGCLRALAWGPVGSPFLGLPGAHGPYPGTGRPQAWAGP